MKVEEGRCRRKLTWEQVIWGDLWVRGIDGTLSQYRRDREGGDLSIWPCHKRDKGLSWLMFTYRTCHVKHSCSARACALSKTVRRRPLQRFYGRCQTSIKVVLHFRFFYFREKIVRNKKNRNSKVTTWTWLYLRWLQSALKIFISKKKYGAPRRSWNSRTELRILTCELLYNIIVGNTGKCYSLFYKISWRHMQI